MDKGTPKLDIIIQGLQVVYKGFYYKISYIFWELAIVLLVSMVSKFFSLLW
jgi:hypothetical protein